MISDMITRRRVIGYLGGATAWTLLSGRGFAAPATNPQPAPAGPVTQVSVTVSNTPNGAIGPAFAGLSYDKVEMIHTLFRASNRDLVALFKLLGSSLLRLANWREDLVWTPNGPGQTRPQISRRDVDGLAGFVKATGWRCLYSVNLAGSANGSSSPEMAADEVAYAAQQFGPALYGVEIGNEPDSYGKPGRQYAGRWSLGDFERIWNDYRSAILAKTPGVLIAGPAAGHLADWTIPFSEEETKSKLDLLTDHYYAGHGHSLADFNAQVLLSHDDTLANNLKLMQAAYQKTGIPYRIGETNSNTAAAFGVSDTYVASLWCLDYLFTCAQGGATGVNLHGGAKAAYTPIEDDKTHVTAVRPEYYGILFFTMAGQGTLYRTEVSGRSSNVAAYAVKTPTGMNVVVVNKDQAQNLGVTLRLPQTVNSANLIGMSQSSSNVSATSGVTIQGSGVGTDGRFSPAPAYTLDASGSQVTCHVPALSAALIQIV